MFLIYEPGRTLRSSSSSLLTVPQDVTKTSGNVAFSYTGTGTLNDSIELFATCTKSIDEAFTSNNCMLLKDSLFRLLCSLVCIVFLGILLMVCIGDL